MWLPNRSPDDDRDIFGSVEVFESVVFDQLLNFLLQDGVLVKIFSTSGDL